MTKKFCVFALGIALVSILQSPSPANAQASTQAAGPICFSTLPFPDVLVWYFDGSGATANASHFDATGRDLSGSRAQTVAFHITPGNPRTLHFGYTTHPAAGFVPVIAGGTIDLSTLSGPGQCFAPDLASCGAFTMAFIACPATAAEEAGAEAAGGAQGSAK
jgi:hypothetical protein